MRQLEDLINQARRSTENQITGSTQGIDDLEFIQYFNDAQERLQSKILKYNYIAFEDDESQDVVANQAKYLLPERTYLSNRVINVEFSRTGLIQDFYPLRRKTIRERNNITAVNMDSYIPVAGAILLDPIPSESRSKNLRISFARQFDRLDTKRFEVAAVTLATDTITSLSIRNLDDSIPLDEDKLVVMNTDFFMSVYDNLGAMQMRNIQFDSIDATTGVVTVNSGFTFEGETMVVGDLVSQGKNTTNRSEFPDEAERYLLAYVAWKIFKRDSSQDSSEAESEMLALEEDILDNYKEISDDIEQIAIIDESFVGG